MLYGMAFLPVTDVANAIELIRSTMPAVGHPVIEYFDSTYVNGLIVRSNAGGSRVHRAPLFPPAMWNVAERFEHDLPITSNHVEAWHHRMQTIIVIDHPSFYSRKGGASRGVNTSCSES